MSIRDPVFGTIEVWQIVVLTLGYWIGIELYLDGKYEKEEAAKDAMPKVSASSFAAAKAKKEAQEAAAAGGDSSEQE